MKYEQRFNSTELFTVYNKLSLNVLYKVMYKYAAYILIQRKINIFYILMYYNVCMYEARNKC